MVCRRSGCVGAMVVWPQCRRIFSHHAIPWDDVLFPPESRESSCIFLPAVHHSLLVTHFPVHLGWSSPPVIYVASRLGSVAGSSFLHHADRTVMGRYVERFADPSRRVGQGS